MLAEVLNLLTRFIGNLTSREEAFLIWIGIGIVWLLIYKGTRRSVLGFLHALLSPKLAAVYGLMLFYIGVLLWLLHEAGFWHFSMLYDTILWIIGTAFVLFLNFNKLDDSAYLRKILVEMAGVSVLLEFVLNFRSFPLIVELLAFPLVVFLVAVSVVGKLKPETKVVGVAADWILTLIVLVEILYSAVGLFQTGISLLYMETFLISPVLTIELMPFLYGLTRVFSRRRPVSVGGAL